MMEISENLKRILNELPSAVKLVAVSKFKPVEAVLEAYAAGQRVFAESRPQEFRGKVLSAPSDIEWHFIGHLQTNKLKMVVPYVSLIESVDSLRLLDAIDAFAGGIGKIQDILLEVHIAEDEETKQGFGIDEILDITGHLSKYQNIRFRGLMGMASNTDDMDLVRSEFNKLKSLFDQVRSLGGLRLSSFDTLSMGMSHDYPVAIACGATSVRIGTAIFGERN